MAVFLAPIGNGDVFLASNALPAAGGQIFTYLAGTTTPTATYTTSAGSIANTNPIVLTPAGLAPFEIWLPQGFTYKFIVTDALGNQIGPTYDNLQGIGDNIGGGGTSNIGIPVNAQTGTSYHPVLADAPQASCYQGTISMNNSSANTVTIDPHSTTAWVANTVINLIQRGTGQSSFAAGGGVTLINASSLNCRAQNSLISAYLLATDLWLVFGDMA